MRLRFNMKLKKSWIEVLDNILNNLAYYENEYTIFIPVQLKIQNGEQIAELIDIFYEKIIHASKIPKLHIFCGLFLCFRTERFSTSMPHLRQRMATELWKKCQKALGNQEVENEYNECSSMSIQTKLKNVNLIIQLVKLKMFTEDILFECIEFLLRQEMDENVIEYLFRILIEYGQNLSKNNLHKMKNFFDRIEKITKKVLRPDLKLALIALIDFKKNSWIFSYNDTNNPKKNTKSSRKNKQKITQKEFVKPNRKEQMQMNILTDKHFDSISIENIGDAKEFCFVSNHKSKLLLIYDPKTKQLVNSNVYLDDDNLLAKCSELSCLTKKSVESKPIDKDHEVTELICPICLESVKNLKSLKVRIMSTQCGHIVCDPCSSGMFKCSKTKSIECPICRKSLKLDSIHEIYL